MHISQLKLLYLKVVTATFVIKYFNYNINGINRKYMDAQPFSYRFNCNGEKMKAKIKS